MSEIFLAFVGNANSGKSTSAKHLAKELDLPVTTGSNILTKLADERGIRLGAREDYAKFQKSLRDELGPAFLMDISLRGASGRGVLIDGLRNYNDSDLFQSVGGITVAIWCPVEVRFRRGLERSSPKDAATFEDFIAAEADEYADPDPRGIHLLQIMQMADYHIDGNQPPESVITQANQILELVT